MKFSTNNALHQRIMSNFVSREVIYCVSHLVSELRRNYEAFPEHEDDLLDAGGFTRETVDPDQYRLIVDLDERGEVATSVYAIDSDGEDSRESVWSCHGPWEDTGYMHCKACDEEFDVSHAGSERCPVCGEKQIFDHITEGINNLDGSECFDPRDTGTVCEYLIRSALIPKESTMLDECDDVNTSEKHYEVFEHWIVSHYLGELLQEQGEQVLEDFFGLDYVWCRTTTGQAIYIDEVIANICSTFGDDHWVQREALTTA